MEFDLIVIGTGTAASTAALACRSVGWKVAIIDSLPFGGTCALRGCEPKKVLVEAAKTIDSSKKHQNKGITGSERIRHRGMVTRYRSETGKYVYIFA